MLTSSCGFSAARLTTVALQQSDDRATVETVNRKISRGPFGCMDEGVATASPGRTPDKDGKGK